MSPFRKVYRIFLLLHGEERPRVADRPGAHAHERADGFVAFERVSFRYQQDLPLIEDLSLVAEPGHTVAIVGPTGAGKTTLVNLIMRFYELDSGRITLDGVDITDLRRTEEVFAPVGRTIRVPESQQDAVTALSGSGPASFFYLVEAMTDAGILLGLPRGVAHDLIVQTAIGSAVMLRDSGEHPVKLREAVTSPAGTTISAIRELENHGVRAALLAALEAARDRARQIAEQQL